MTLIFTADKVMKTEKWRQLMQINRKREEPNSFAVASASLNLQRNSLKKKKFYFTASPAS